MWLRRRAAHPLVKSCRHIKARNWRRHQNPKWSQIGENLHRSLSPKSFRHRWGKSGCHWRWRWWSREGQCPRGSQRKGESSLASQPKETLPKAWSVEQDDDAGVTGLGNTTTTCHLTSLNLTSLYHISNTWRHKVRLNRKDQFRYILKNIGTKLIFFKTIILNE